jgi:hypothetical protein
MAQLTQCVSYLYSWVGGAKQICGKERVNLQLKDAPKHIFSRLGRAVLDQQRST